MAGENHRGEDDSRCESMKQGILEECNKSSVNEGTVRNRQLMEHAHTERAGVQLEWVPLGSLRTQWVLRKTSEEFHEVQTLHISPLSPKKIY